MSIMNKQSLKVDNVVTTECRSCLETKNAILMKGKLCSECIRKSGKFLRDTDKELLKNLTEVDISNRVCL